MSIILRLGVLIILFRLCHPKADVSTISPGVSSIPSGTLIRKGRPHCGHWIKPESNWHLLYNRTNGNNFRLGNLRWAGILHKRHLRPGGDLTKLTFFGVGDNLFGLSCAITSIGWPATTTSPGCNTPSPVLAKQHRLSLRESGRRCRLWSCQNKHFALHGQFIHKFFLHGRLLRMASRAASTDGPGILAIKASCRAVRLSTALAPAHMVFHLLYFLARASCNALALSSSYRATAFFASRSVKIFTSAA